MLELSHWAAPAHSLPTPPLRAGSTPPVLIWQSFMVFHPDKRFVEYILQGLSSGFRIGFNPKAVNLQSSFKNHQSVTANSATVTKYINAERALGRVNGPFHPAQAIWIHTSPIGMIPKPHQPSKWRLIVDMSFPEGHSVNDGIASDVCSLKYSTVDDAVELIRHQGNEALMSKLDLKSAY